MYVSPSESVINWLQANQSKNSFASNVFRTLKQYGTISDKQNAAIERSLTPATVTNVAGEGFNLLVRSFNHARAANLKKPRLHVGEFKFSLAPENSRNPGYIYAHATGEYAGKISPNGTYTPWNASPAVVDKLAEIARDPFAHAVAHGHATGRCAICGRHLSDSESVTRGIGPVCAKKFGWL